MELVNLKIRRYPDLIRGIVIEYGLQWMLLRENVVDYVLDGYLFVNHDYIQQVIESSQDTLDYKVLVLKDSSILSSVPNMDNYKDLIGYLKEKHLLIAIGLDRQNSIIVGYVKVVNENSLTLTPIRVDLIEMSVIKIDYKKIRYISIMSDYLTSISNYLAINRESYFK